VLRRLKLTARALSFQPTIRCEYVSNVRLFRECPSCAATCVTGTPSVIFTLA